ncbi:MFS transporter, partial [Vibrio parahaemolyticus]|nr:MFS transporter [Vibrio parahaemolyticus]
LACAADALSGGGHMVVSSLVSMTLEQLGFSEAWHLSLVVVLFTAITLTNILRGLNTEEEQQHRDVAEKAS